MKKIKIRVEKGLVVLTLSKSIEKYLLDNELLVEGVNGYRFVDPINIEIENDKPMTKAEKVVDVKEWIEEYRECFPKGLNSNGYPYRGEKEACTGKMQTFVRSYNYTKDEILEATKIMIGRFKIKNYEFMPQAHYFIEKNRVSQLKQFCDMVKDGVVDLKDIKERVEGI